MANLWTRPGYEPSTAIENNVILNKHALNILHIFRHCRIVNSFENNLQSLTLKLDNIKLRYIIWLRSCYTLEDKNHGAVTQLLEGLEVFLVGLIDVVREIGAHGMIEDNDLTELDHDCEDEDDRSKLDVAFRFHVEKHLARNRSGAELQSAPSSWIVVDIDEFLSFLQIVDSTLEDLYARSTSELSLALSTGYATSIAKSLDEGQLMTLKQSCLTEQNILYRAAETQLGRKNGEVVAFKKGLEIDTDSVTEAGSSTVIFTPKTSVASLDVSERFARLTEKSAQTHENVLLQQYPVGNLARRRILSELRNADINSPLTSISCIDNSIMNLLGIIRGPPDSPYEDGIFFIRIEIPEDYPLKAARYRFLTKIYHPNISTLGEVCVKMAEPDWAISCSIWGLLASFVSLLSCPEYKNALIPMIGSQCQNDKKLFETTAREWTEEHARGQWPTDSELSAPIYSVEAEKKMATQRRGTSQFEKSKGKGRAPKGL